MKYSLFLFIFFIIQNLAFGQSESVDSIKSFISTLKEDSVKVNSMLALSNYYFDTNPQEAIRIAEEASLLARKVGFLKGAAYGLKNQGIGLYYQGNYVEAISVWKKSLAVFDSIDNKQGSANILSNLGAIYYNEGDYNNALDHYLRSLKVSEQINDTLRIVTALLNIGAVYIDKPATQDKAYEYSLKALKLSEKIKYNDAIATSSVNMGEIYLLSEALDSAQFYFDKALAAMEGIDGKIYTMVSLSMVYTRKGDFNQALKILEDAILLADSLKLKPNKTHALVALAETYYQMQAIQKSIEAYKTAHALALEIKSIKDLEKIYQGLQGIYAQTNRFDSAYKYQQLLLGVKDSIYNSETEKILENQMFNFEIEKKQNEINFLTKEQELNNRDLLKQKVINYLVAAGLVSVVIFLIVALTQKKRITKEKERSEELILNILPKEIADELKVNGKSEARDFSEVTVLFTDFKEFTDLSQKLTAKELVEEVNFYFKSFDHISTKYGIEKIKTIGDAYMAASGLPNPETHSVRNVILAALEMQKVIANRHNSPENENSKLFNMRIGIHTGPVVAGIVGVKKFQYDIWGDTVNTASRMESNSEIGQVNISQYTYERVKDSELFSFESRKMIDVKGKGKMQMYFVKLKAI